MLDLDPATRAALFARLAALLDARIERDDPVAPAGAPSLDELPHDPIALIEAAASALRAGQVHPTHPRYFGLFNPAPTALAIAADALVAAYNPQLATKSHAAWPVAVEQQLLAAFGERFGYADAEGCFTSGGGEANLVAVLSALHQRFADFADRGARALPGDPTLYVSAEAHPTIARAARVAGLGRAAVRVIPADAAQRMKVRALREAIARDRAASAVPFLIVATVGTTSSGSLDPVEELANVAAAEGCWLHVDAAYGGLLALLPEQRAHVAACARADSITFDPHKALSVPMGAGMYLSRHRLLADLFADRGGYMPRDASEDPYARSLQWSRRFIGLKLFLTLASVGWDGYAASLRRQLALADRLRAGLAREGFRVINDTPLPVVCFVDRERRDLPALARAVIGGNGGWLSVTRLASGERVLRACVNNHRTEERDVDHLIEALVRARG